MEQGWRQQKNPEGAGWMLLFTAGLAEFLTSVGKGKCVGLGVTGSLGAKVPHSCVGCWKWLAVGRNDCPDKYCLIIL